MKSIGIIGAGPAGLMAAIEAAQENVSITILERSSAAGAKLLLTGGGRCNLTHAGRIDDFIKACRPFGNSLKPSFYALSPQELIRFFDDRGLAMTTEPNGGVFPKHGRAADVRRILLNEAQSRSVELRLNSRVTGIQKYRDSFSVHTENKSWPFDAVIIAAGGMSWPKTGSSGDGYQWANTFGHTIISPLGLLCPIVCQENWPGSLQGTSLEQVAITVRNGTKSIVCQGAAVFTDNGIGGFAAFDVTRATAHDIRLGKAVPASLDFCPLRSRQEIEADWLKTCAEHPKKEMVSILNSDVPRRVSELLLSRVGAKPGISGGRLPREERKGLLNLLKAMPLTIIHHGSLEKATVTSGGVDGKEIDFKTMQSRLCPGLFFAGEVLDVDGPCGGYNLQIAFSTGALAGRSAARYIRP
jgi:predicted Rossmann fold flavoprotein